MPDAASRQDTRHHAWNRCKEKDAQIAELQHRMDELEARLKTLEDAAAPAKPADDSATQQKSQRCRQAWTLCSRRIPRKRATPRTSWKRSTSRKRNWQR